MFGLFDGVTYDKVKQSLTTLTTRTGRTFWDIKVDYQHNTHFWEDYYYRLGIRWWDDLSGPSYRSRVPEAERLLRKRGRSSHPPRWARLDCPSCGWTARPKGPHNPTIGAGRSAWICKRGCVGFAVVKAPTSPCLCGLCGGPLVQDLSPEIPRDNQLFCQCSQCEGIWVYDFQVHGGVYV